MNKSQNKKMFVYFIFAQSWIFGPTWHLSRSINNSLSFQFPKVSLSWFLKKKTGKRIAFFFKKFIKLIILISLLLNSYRLSNTLKETCNGKNSKPVEQFCSNGQMSLFLEY